MTKILIIEDTDKLRENLADAMELQGYEVLHADNGKTGIEVAKEFLPDLILCDIVMPELSGLEVLEILKAEDQQNTVPFIFISALAERTNVRTGMDLGADDYLTKPFSASELLRAIATRLEKHNSIENKIKLQYDRIESELAERVDRLTKQNENQKNIVEDISITNEQLVEQLNEKQAQLMHEALKAIEINSTMQGIAKQLTQELQKSRITEEQKKIISDLRNKIRKRSVLLNNWTIFQLKFDQTYPHFTSILLERFPNLTQQERVIVSAIYTKLNSYQLSVILNIKPPSVRKYKYRIKQKIGLSKEEDLSVFIQQFH